MKTKLVYVALVLLSGIILIYSCSKSYNNTPMPMGSAASVSIQNMAFTPDTLRIKTGTTVTWNNMDGVTHTVTSLNGLFDSGNLGAGFTFHYTFAMSGTFAYHCLIHSAMKGVVIVSN